MSRPRFVNLDELAKIGSCTTEILADLAVTEEKLADGSVTSTKLGAGAVDASALSDGSITAPKLAGDVFGAGIRPNATTNAIDINVDNATLHITSDVLRVNTGGINQTHINLTGDLSFNSYQATNFRVENVSSDPTPGNPGRLIWRTDINQLRVDDGIAFTSIGSGSGGHIIEDEGSALPQRAVLNFVGAGVTATDSGGKTVVTIPGGGSSAYKKDLFTVVNPSAKTLTLSQVPATDSEIVMWNGLLLRPGVSNDYTTSANTVTLNAGLTLTVGDELLVVYAY